MSKTSRPLRVAFPPCGVHVLESHHEDDFRMDWTSHRFLKIIYVIEGGGRLMLGDRDLKLRSPSVALTPAGVRHRIEDDSAHPLSLYVLCVREDVIRAFRGEKMENCRATTQPVLCKLTEQLLRDMLYEQTVAHPAKDAMLVARVLELWAAWQRHQTGVPATQEKTLPSQRRIEDYLKGLDRNFYHPSSLEEAARSVGLSIRRFTQLFREATGRSWREEVKHRQIQHARKLLQETHRSVLSICFECGFSDLSTFYRSFKTAEKQSPQQWRLANSR